MCGSHSSQSFLDMKPQNLGKYKMKKYILLLLILLLLPVCVGATDYYVRPHATDAACTYGSCDGTSYANAWEGFGAGGDERRGKNHLGQFDPPLFRCFSGQGVHR